MAEFQRGELVSAKDNDDLTGCKNYKIQIASDLHLEFYSHMTMSEEEEAELFNQIVVKNPNAKVLALLGDITILTTDKCREQYRRFIEWALPQWENIVILTGNHEYYRKGSDRRVDIATCDDFLRELERSNECVHFLQQSALDLGYCVILGCTLWSEIPDEEEVRTDIWRKLNDYRSIYTKDIQNDKSLRLIEPNDTNDLHRSHIGWLKAQIELYKDREVVVLTHHTPSMKGTSDPIFDKDINEPNHMAHAFSTDLTQVIHDNPCVKVWAYGHTHYNNRQYYIRNPTDLTSSCLLVSNQYGYYGENLRKGSYRFDPRLLV